MKRILSIFVIGVMVFSMMPVMNIAVNATENVADDTATLFSDESGNTIDKETLKDLGFSMPDEGLFDTEAINSGSYAVQTFSEVVVDISNSVANTDEAPYTLTRYDRNQINPMQINSNLWHSAKSDFANTTAAPYAVSEAFDPKGIGRDSYVARISFSSSYYNSKDAYIQLEVFNGDTNSYVWPMGNDISGGGYVVGRIYTQVPYEMWGIDGYLSISSGDYDGDGMDELAIYGPDNIDESNGSGPCKLRIWICDVEIIPFDGSDLFTMTKKELDLAVSPDGRHCEWQWSADNSTYTYYSVPYVSMYSEDVNNDGICDLLATVNFANNSRGTLTNTTYNRTQALDWNTRFASVLEVWEGVKGAAPKHEVVHRTLVAIDPDDSNVAYALRNANVTVGDVTSYGSKQIILGGNYTYLDYDNTNKVTTTRAVTTYKGDGSVAKNVLGYTTYDNLKKNATTAVNSGYTWLHDAGYGDLHYYNSDKVNEPVSLGAFRAFGDGDIDTLFIAGRLYKYDANENKLKYLNSIEGFYGSDIDSEDRSNVWLGRCAVGNVGGDVYGRETLYVPMTFKKSGKNTYRADIYSVYGNYNGDTVSYAGGRTIVLNNVTGSTYHVSMTMGDFNEDSPIISYTDGDTDVYYSKLNILSILQAPPIYKELDVLNSEYSGNSETSFAKSKGTGTEVTNGGSVTAGVVAGFEQETSFLGLFKCAGAEYELKVTGSVGGEKSTEKTVDYSTGYSITGANDAAVIFTVPYVRYNCMMYVPAYSAPSESEYWTKWGFCNALKRSIEAYEETSAAQSDSNYKSGCAEYGYKYTANVNSSNYAQQLMTLSSVEEDLEIIRKTIKHFDEGGTLDWDQKIEGRTQPYHYCVPQTPMVTTVSVETYDKIVSTMPGYDTISDTVFGEYYVAGDPSTYAHNVSDLNVSSNLLYDTTGTGGTADGFVTSSNISSGASSQSQSITVSKAEGKAVTYGAAVESTAAANLAGAKVGFTMCAEYNGSTAWTTTEGNEYSATIANLPDGTPGEYTYGWKLVGYNTKINGSEVPVVGYLTKMTTTPPKSVAENVSIENVTDSTVTLSWEKGNRGADYYNIYSVYNVNGVEKEILAASKVVGDEEGYCEYTIENLTPSTMFVYVIKSYSANGVESVTSEPLSVTTLPSGIDATISIEGVDVDKIYADGAEVKLTSVIENGNGIATFYVWQLNQGEGWKDMEGFESQNISFKLNEALDMHKIRCVATVMLSQSTAYTLYSNALEIRCGQKCDEYRVSWAEDMSSVTVNFEEAKNDVEVYVVTYDQNGSLVDAQEATISSDKLSASADIAEKPENGSVKVFVWDENMRPIGPEFEN